MKNEKPPNAEPIQVKIPSAKRKTPGGADHPDWNNRTTNLMVTALPINLEDSGEVTDAATAVIFGIMEIIQPIRLRACWPHNWSWRTKRR